ncbi:MAG TPA: zf-HC2 domain-containing protein [Vicinamibacteria bacterium]|nr:zf-HC2 domain-containing protein [Vicinamibacteria bacterium]
MSGAHVVDRLDDYMDGDLSEAEFQEVELHLAGCADCAAEHAFLGELLAGAASLPKSVAPPRDLWPGIAARLRRRTVPSSYWLAGLAAAAALLVTLTLTLKPRPTPTATTTSLPAGGEIVPASARLPPELEAAEAEYERATAQLMAAIAQRRDSLPPATMAALHENLRTIDDALASVRAAVIADPTNPRLNHLLASTHQRKVETLRRVVKLTT